MKEITQSLLTKKIVGQDQQDGLNLAIMELLVQHKKLNTTYWKDIMKAYKIDNEDIVQEVNLLICENFLNVNINGKVYGAYNDSFFTTEKFYTDPRVIKWAKELGYEDYNENIKAARDITSDDISDVINWGTNTWDKGFEWLEELVLTTYRGTPYIEAWELCKEIIEIIESQ